MSTSDETDDRDEPDFDRSENSAEERESAGTFEDIRAAVLVTPAHLELVGEALRDVARLEIATDIDALLAADAQLVIVEHALLENREMRTGPSAPIRVVIEAPYEARIALQRSGAADLAVEPGIDRPELQARIEALLRRARLERDRNPLTGLPGNRWLVRRLREAARERDRVGVLLLDIDDFKGYNDRHGHLRGDAAIDLLGRIVAQVADAVAGAFTAHIGGDDFCVVCAPEALDSIAEACRERFDREAGGLTVTLAGTLMVREEVSAVEEVFVRLAKLKSEGKRRPRSSYVRG